MNMEHEYEEAIAKLFAIVFYSLLDCRIKLMGFGVQFTRL